MNVYILKSAENVATYGIANNQDEKFISLDEEPKVTSWPDIILEEKFGDAKEIGCKADFHTTSLLAFLVSQTMVDKIGDLLRKNGELYPVKIIGRNQNFYRYHCTNIVDCLDYKKSTYKDIKLSFFNKKISVRKPFFIETKISDNIIFRIPKTALPTIYVTEEFKEIVIENKITGIKLMKDRYDFDGWES